MRGSCSFQRVFSLAFLVDTASELLPEHFGVEGFGQAKRNIHHERSGNEFSRKKSEKAKTKGN
jgi:hypothetical protein